MDNRSKRFTPRLGMEVAVCYDGKWSRSQLGEVVAVNKRTFDVAFVPWASDTTERHTLHISRRKSKKSYGGWLVGGGEVGILRWLGCRGDWYSVLPAHLLRDSGYTVGESSASTLACVGALTHLINTEADDTVDRSKGE
jgi:hypothetical protein